MDRKQNKIWGGRAWRWAINCHTKRYFKEIQKSFHKKCPQKNAAADCDLDPSTMNAKDLKKNCAPISKHFWAKITKPDTNVLP